jgi:23S rRNA C2498 (ribose-2'-O)-methylase RlmM
VLALLDQWTRNAWCKHLVLHLKFKGDAEYPLADQALQLLQARFPIARRKHLYHDKNEITLLASSG